MATKNDKIQQNLSVDQENAIELLIVGKNDREVAEAINVNRSTVTEWRNHDPLFIAELNRRRKELWNAQKTKIASLFKKSVEVLEKGLESEEEKIRFETAKYLLEKFGIEEMKFEPYGDVDSEEIKRKWKEAEEQNRRKREKAEEEKRREKIIEEKTKHLRGTAKMMAQFDLRDDPLLEVGNKNK